MFNFKKHIHILILIIVIYAIAFFGATFSRAVYYIQPDDAEVPRSVVEEMIKQDQKPILETTVNALKPEIIIPEENSPGRPVHLSIPKIKVDAKVGEVGITKKGNVGAPNNFVDAGWYKYGTLPGAEGNVIIDGHVDNGLSFPGVFSALKDLTEGDDIFITTAEGANFHYIVTKSDTYNFDNKIESIFPDNTKKQLQLITCAGTWMQEFNTHNKRLVVTAVLVE